MVEIDINVDMGEGGAEDAQLIRLASSANIACGGHAGDDVTIPTSIQLAIEADVLVGAHPGFEDRGNFGRVEIQVTPADVHALMVRQLSRFLHHAKALGADIHHVKPHGALYHQANRDPLLAAAVIAAIRDICPTTTLYAPPNGCLAAAAKASGFNVKAEGFADRRYQADGNLAPRNEIGAVLADPADALAQSLQLIRSGTIQTLCVHGDGPQAVTILQHLRAGLEKAGVRITG